MSIRESGEMYLETILILSRSSSEVHSIDVADYMNVSKPSVSRAVGILKNAGYIVTGKDNSLVLTDMGLEAAERIYDRHITIAEMLRSLGVSEENAVNDACKMEHDISEETFLAFKKHLNEHFE
ncbi:MAG: metal-dependent transcriptional regulator [Eubacteriales bacterium]|mgnify:FL=1|nr:metal-dependent transcriptional regulator [Eubacteriales bacterium]MDD6018331.1 metal-dependent transcriptional regulator [Clostridiales bacterium]MDD7688052.1 metal-dependent transcriptional regulator [Clostridiales bacterium]MDY2598210.1 metal-dependent transcriptional regulator [Eubacteriales bacterium]MDY3309015.1 metal-dependent transcriptional regulator [Eubacteriales bacterium]